MLSCLLYDYDRLSFIAACVKFTFLAESLGNKIFDKDLHLECYQHRRHEGLVFYTRLSVS